RPARPVFRYSSTVPISRPRMRKLSEPGMNSSFRIGETIQLCLAGMGHKGTREQGNKGAREQGEIGELENWRIGKLEIGNYPTVGSANFPRSSFSSRARSYSE